MKSTTRYYIQRLKPMFWFFMIAETLLRGILVVREYQNLEGDLSEVFKSFAIGIAFDIGVFAYFIIPLAIYLMSLPSHKHITKVDKRICGGIYFMMIYMVLFTAVSELIFWEEFASRFNFIAVDYLVYTHEVIGNIWESYPIVWLLSAIGIVTFLLTLLLLKYVSEAVGEKPPRFAGRSAAFGVSILIAILSFNIVSGSIAGFGDNRYWQEIAKNGYFEIFSAFRHNDLSYNKFYEKVDDDVALNEVRNELGGRFIDKGLTRYITAKAPEKHYNVMLITVESLSAVFMERFGFTGYKGEGILPNIDRLAKESLFFSDIRATGTRTVYGLSAINLSIPPIPGNSIVRRDNNEELFSLASVLNKKGYESKFIYGGFGYFDNMNYFFANNGYEVVDRSNLSDEEITFANIWGVCDEDLYNRALKEADTAFKKNKPFFNMLMTTSNHRPYTFPEGRINLTQKDKRMAGLKYTDYAVGKFIEDAKSKPWFDNTIFVIVADHTAGSSGKSSLDPDRYHIPMMIYAPKIIKPQEVDKFASQIDLAPTLLGLMNMSYKSKFYGVDLMKKSPERSFISNYQKLGYLTKDDLIIIEPIKKVSSFKLQGSDVIKVENSDDDLIKKTIANFQTASRWMELSRDD